MRLAKRRLPLLALFILLCTCGHAQMDINAEEDLYDLTHIVEIELEMFEDNWKKQLNFWKKQNKKDRTLATLKVDGITYDSVGVRLKGNSSYYAPAKAEKKKLPFNIKVSHTDKKQKVDGKYRTLKLSNVFRDPSYLRESLSYAIARDYVPASGCNYARLTVNGDYFGLYNLTESVDENFWAEKYASETGILFKCDPESKDPPPSKCPPGVGANLSHLGTDSVCYMARYELKKADSGWQDLIDLTKAVENEKTDFTKILNVDEALWMLAFNNAMVNLDSYLGLFCHNYYLFKDESGLWRPVIWDLNLSMGGFRLVKENEVLNNKELTELSPFIHFKERNMDRPLVIRLLDKPLFRKMYVAHLQTIFEEQFAEEQYRERTEQIRETITSLVVREPNPLYPTETYTQNYHQTVDIPGGEILGIEEFFEKRGSYLKSHPLFQKPTPSIADHTATKAGDTVTVSVSLATGESSDGVWVVHRPSVNSPFVYTQLKPEADGNYVASLSAAEINEYFLVAESSISATVLPARSAREWFTVK